MLIKYSFKTAKQKAIFCFQEHLGHIHSVVICLLLGLFTLLNSCSLKGMWKAQSPEWEEKKMKGFEPRIS